jgi:hypothetical protein
MFRFFYGPTRKNSSAKNGDYNPKVGSSSRSLGMLSGTKPERNVQVFLWANASQSSAKNGGYNPKAGSSSRSLGIEAPLYTFIPLYL